MSNDYRDFDISEADKKYVLSGNKHEEIRDMLLAAGKQLFNNGVIDSSDFEAYKSQINNAQFVIKPDDWFIDIYPIIDEKSFPIKENVILEFPQAVYFKQINNKQEPFGAILFMAFENMPGYISAVENTLYDWSFDSNVWPRAEQFDYPDYRD